MTATQLKRHGLFYWALIRETCVKWDADNISRLSAALAFYTIFSLAPLLILAIAVAGLFFGHSAARIEVVGQLQSIVGDVGAQYINNLIELAQKPSSTLIASIGGFITLMVGATSTFVELQESLNIIWKTEARGNGFHYFLHKRLLSFAGILSIGTMILLLLIAGAVLGFMSRHLSGVVPAYFLLLSWANMFFSFGVIAALFAAIYKILPDTKVKWKDVWMGALMASLLFSFGKYFIGLYLRHSSMGSLYGAAGSLVIILLWIYYSAQILFFGAEFTEVYARRSKR